MWDTIGSSESSSMEGISDGSLSGKIKGKGVSKNAQGGSK